MPENKTTRILLAGWFSFKYGHATAGDLLALDVTIKWLDQAGFTNYDIAFDPPFKKYDSVDWRTVNSCEYTFVIFICGPFDKSLYEAQFLKKFEKCKLIGLNLSMIPPINEWNPFDFLLERNSDLEVRADMVFASNEPKVPVVGICLVENYDGALVNEINDFIKEFIESKEIATVFIDTRLDKNRTNLKSKAEIESLISRVDLLITTRLHGTVLALKNGIPVIPIDPEPEGAKIVKQINKIGWPIVYTFSSLSYSNFSQSFDYCLTEEAKSKSLECYSNAIDSIEIFKSDFISELKSQNQIERNYKARFNEPNQNDWIDIQLADSKNDKKSNFEVLFKKVKKKLKSLINY